MPKFLDTVTCDTLKCTKSFSYYGGHYGNVNLSAVYGCFYTIELSGGSGSRLRFQIPMQNNKISTSVTDTHFWLNLTIMLTGPYESISDGQPRYIIPLYGSSWASATLNALCLCRDGASSCSVYTHYNNADNKWEKMVTSSGSQGDVYESKYGSVTGGNYKQIPIPTGVDIGYYQ